MTFDKFIKTHATCRRITGSKLARKIFSEIVWNEQVRIKMAELSDMNIPALAACALEIEKLCLSHAQADIDLDDDTTKQIIGRMISASMAPLGYVSVKKKRLPLAAGLAKFKNATTFTRTGNAIQRIEKRIVDIEQLLLNPRGGA